MKKYDYKGKPGTAYWVVTFVYSVEKFGWGVPDKEIRKLLGNCDGAGTGFGERDMDWAFADLKSAEKAMKLLEPFCDGDDAKAYLDERAVESDEDDDA